MHTMYITMATNYIYIHTYIPLFCENNGNCCWVDKEWEMTSMNISFERIVVGSLSYIGHVISKRIMWLILKISPDCQTDNEYVIKYH